MEAKPLRIVPSSHNTSGEGSGGPQKKIDMGHTMKGGDVDEEEKKRVVMVKEEKNSSPVELDIGVAAISACPNKCCLFTEAQKRELDHQVLIFNHFAYNLPLPHHLVQFPTNMSEYTRFGFDYGSMVDPEPYRCRRTDGKKWRCGKKVVPDQKYCERHMHRGRNRSRKPVETSQVNSPLITKPSGKLHTKVASHTESAVSNPNLLAIQPSGTSSCAPSRSLCIVNTSSANDNRSKNITGFSGSTVASMAYVASDNRSCLDICKKDNQTKSCISNNISIRSGGKGSIIYDSNGISTGFGFSPKSVLQVSGCNHPYLNDRNSIEPEPGRCRRTDGKKWRCKSAVLPGQKYCATHMHRGAKKRFTNHEPATTTTATSTVTIARLPYSTVATTNIQQAYCKIPNTNLSMSVPASAPFIQCNEKSPSSSDTDTTITDTMNECSYSSF
ncbi:growth-regulating factor 9-like isoform X2 [Gastrolobium bilobum]|uniref:growth-regulating factor 9-like isoform X2 n=1 Tax=Gastrolobium bilobum TaxID=150636 RepID=UPI002AB0F779|nr:growth-regulating factor 9-like isoform X2 [Gastrolobium bilobum]